MSVASLVQAAAILTALVSVIAALNLPQHLLELLTHFRLQYLLAAIVLALACGVLHRYGYATAMLATAVLNGFFVLPWYAARDGELPGSTDLKLLHANVLSSNRKYQPLLDLVAEENPDIVLLQEITADWVEGLRSLQTDYPHFYTEPREGNFGIAVYSKIEFDAVRHVDSPPLGYPTIVLTATVGEEALTLVSSHPTIPLGGTLSAARNQQFDSLQALLRTADSKTVLVGDFNATMWDSHLQALQSAAGLTSVRQGFGILPTWPVYMPLAMIPIDHVLVPDSVGVRDVKTGKRIGSDHLPLIVTLSL